MHPLVFTTDKKAKGENTFMEEKCTISLLVVFLLFGIELLSRKYYILVTRKQNDS